MQKIRAAYRVVTPMFLGRGPESAEMRATSVRGALRFWFRAIAWGAYAPHLSQLKEAEARVFGGVGKGQGQGAVLVRVSRLRDGDMRQPLPATLAYLGYGCVKPSGSRAKPARPFLATDQEFAVELLVRRNQERASLLLEQDEKHLRLALEALGLFGGLGSRARNGLGSVQLHSLTGSTAGDLVRPEPSCIVQLRELVRDFLDRVGELPTGFPEFTAFSDKTRIEVVRLDGKDGTWALHDLGRKLLKFRSYGRLSGGRRLTSGGDEPEQTFADDHDDMFELARDGRAPARAPERVIFGLPHNYFFGSLRRIIHISPPSGIERRASPLFFHVHALQGGQYAAVITLFRARFLPRNKNEVVVKAGRSYRLPAPTGLTEDDWLPITEWLDKLREGAV